MTINTFLKGRRSKSLADQIKDTEQQILNHRQRVKLNSTQLIGNIHDEMTALTTLLFAGGAGFMLAEATTHQGSTVQISTLTTALNFLISAHTLYMDVVE